ncbi:MAG: fumarylacetoacetate hydrolase family protein [Proteobacteria bacterium]|nr:fumarylacetoacetate hydrolase family protein [Pseudomonadota bacterium]MBU1389067.1 fumarylacetoacetate hydrolase family protein [Pseudomonadota bacterium]MBU1543620.1 fumarylacetoacetate hydrolase family protein [Pseudomonadota bacterium]MBU2479824.1 fumarylacetoacetate hydrolase family protein [Pseudomonadota bacterium]
MRIIKFESDDGRVYSGCDFKDHTASVIEGDLFGKFADTGKRKSVKKIMAPVFPAAIFCIGLNYRLHAREIGFDLPKYPVVFMKNPAAVTGHMDDVLIPLSCAKIPEVDYEAELCVVIKKAAKNVPADRAAEYILGYTCANDISARRWQKHAGGNQWIKAKGFDTFCPLGPWIVTPDEIDNPNALDIECVLNGQTMQKSHTSDMIFSVGQIIEYLSDSVTLLPGTLILTGTPSGVGYTRNPPVFLQPGDVLETKIEKIGTLVNTLRLEE